MKSTNKQQYDRMYLWVAVSFAISIILLIVSTVLFMIHRDYSVLVPIKDDVFGQYGNFIGGTIGTILGFISIFLLYKTLKEQRITFERQQIEARFFNLLQIHRKNAELITNKAKKYIMEIGSIYEGLVKYDLEHSLLIGQNKLIGIAYLIFFYGIDNDQGKRTVIEVIQQKIPGINIELIKDFIEEKGDSMETTEHEVDLGHYFRHLHQIVKFINGCHQDILPYKDKYEYIKTLRAQLTTYEQILLLWDSLSPLGKAWEMREREKNEPNEDNMLISKYNLIKNIPAKYAEKGIKPDEYYPNVEFDWLLSSPKVARNNYH